MDTPHGARGYFSNLHSFRFLAAAGVLVQHAEELKLHAGFISYFHFQGIRMMGGTCVTAFFVLSGFLISYLLMREKSQTGTVSLKLFYQRRFLRIWPLYLLTLFLYRVVLEWLQLGSASLLLAAHDVTPLLHIGYWGEWALLLLMLPQVLLATGHVFVPVHVWSIGVEELFYIFWSLILKAAHTARKAFITVLAVYLGVYLFALAGLYLSHTLYWPLEGLWKGSVLFLYAQRISCMAIGALAAEAVMSNRAKLLHTLRSTGAQAICYVALIVMLAKGIIGPVLVNEIYSLLFAIVIINIIHPEQFLFRRLTNSILEKLGEISYGVYMFNPFAILLTVELFIIANIQGTSVWFDIVLFYIVCTFITIAISTVSYKYFERPLLQKKKYVSTT